MISLVKRNGKKNTMPETREPGIETEELKTRLELLYDVALKASSASEVSELIEQILSITQGMLNGSASSLHLVGGGKAETYFQTVDAKTGNILRQKTFQLDSGIARWVALNRKPLIIKDVYRDGRFDKNIDAITKFVTRSLIAVPLIKGNKTISVLEILNKADEGEFDERDLAILNGVASTEALILLVSLAQAAINNIAAQDSWLDGYKKTAEVFAQATDAKDVYSLGHSHRVRKHTMLAASFFPLSPDELQSIEFGAILHDIGKIGINEDLLRKPGPLTDKEWAIMRQHSEIGANIVGEIPFLEKTKSIILYHHERYDGRGYPKELKGKQIPIGARLVAVADAFDTMTTEHSYQGASTPEEAIQELIHGSGTQFCPEVVKTFISAMKRDTIRLEYTETDYLNEQKLDIPEVKLENLKKNDKNVIDIESEILEGEIELALSNVDNVEQVKRLKAALKKNENIQISMARWSEDKGHSIIISLSEPLPLLKILKEIPGVSEAYLKGKELVVEFNTILAS